MEIVSDISTLPYEKVFLDLDTGAVIYCRNCEAYPNTPHQLTLGKPEAAGYDASETPPASVMEEISDPGVDYARIQLLVTEEEGFDAADIPTEATLVEYITKLNGSGKYLVL